LVNSSAQVMAASTPTSFAMVSVIVTMDRTKLDVVCTLCLYCTMVYTNYLTSLDFFRSLFLAFFSIFWVAINCRTCLPDCALFNC